MKLREKSMDEHLKNVRIPKDQESMSHVVPLLLGQVRFYLYLIQIELIKLGGGLLQQNILNINLHKLCEWYPWQKLAQKCLSLHVCPAVNCLRIHIASSHQCSLVVLGGDDKSLDRIKHRKYRHNENFEQQLSTNSNYKQMKVVYHLFLKVMELPELIYIKKAGGRCSIFSDLLRYQ